MNLQTKAFLGLGLIAILALSATAITVSQQNNALTKIESATTAVTNGSTALLLTTTDIATDVVQVQQLGTEP